MAAFKKIALSFVLTMMVFQNSFAAENVFKEVLTANSLGSLSSFTTRKPENIHFQGNLSLISADYSRGAYDGIKEDLKYWGGAASLSIIAEIMPNRSSASRNLYLNVGMENTVSETGLFPNGRPPRIWYESNPYAGIIMKGGESFQLGLTYGIFSSPNGQFSTSQQIAFAMKYKAPIMMMNMLNPEIKIAFPVENGNGFYTEVSVSPSLHPIKDSELQLAAPVVLGMGADDYYGAAKSTVIYGSAGLVISLPLKIVPSEYGSWSLKAGTYIIVRETALANAGKPLDDAGNTVFYGSISLGFVF